MTVEEILGEIEEDQIPALEAAGVIVQQISADPPPSVHEFSVAGPRGVQPQPFDDSTVPELDPGRKNSYMIQLQGPLLPKWRSQIDGLGVSLAESLGQRRYTATLEPDRAQELRRLPFVTRVRLFDQRDNEPELPQRPAANQVFAKYRDRKPEKIQLQGISRLEWVRYSRIGLGTTLRLLQRSTNLVFRLHLRLRKKVLRCILWSAIQVLVDIWLSLIKRFQLWIVRHVSLHLKWLMLPGILTLNFILIQR